MSRNESTSKRGRRRHLTVLTVVGVVTLATVAALATAAGVLLASLPRSAGEADVPGLDAAVTIEIDARGVPRVHAATLEDAFRAQGFLHAQERFFQMDLARRAAAGELAQLVGERALPADRRQRPLRFRALARDLMQRLAPAQRVWIEAYTQGVNAGLADLGARPPEYWLLRAQPAEWREEDSLLVVLSLYTLLSANHLIEQPQGVMRERLPAEVYTFLTPSASRFDRPLLRAPGDPPWAGYEPLPLPAPAVVDLRERPLPDPGRRVVDLPLVGAASNQWAAAAPATAGGNAILANDPHLPLQLPNVFYRAELYWSDAGAVRGASVPGVPGILVGATDQLAWGATASNADQSDWVVVEVDPDDPGRYRVPEGTMPFDTVTEEIAVRGGASRRIEVRSTRWGPVLAEDWRGRPLALRATWMDPDGLNLDLLDLVSAPSVEDALEVLAGFAGPALNWMLADSAGTIGWTVNGPLPRRTGFDGSVPESWADGERGWHGRHESPTALRMDAEGLFTANNRTLPETLDNRLGRVWMRPFRAMRIDELLADGRDFDEHDFLAMQLDTRAQAYDAMRDLLLEVVTSAEDDPLLASARRHAETWNGHADPDHPGFRILHGYYLALLEHVLGPLLAPAAEADVGFVYRWPLADEALRRVLEERPAHLLPAGFDQWHGFLRHILRDMLQALADDTAQPGPDAPWGEVNRLAVAHPLAAVPLVNRLLTLSPAPLPGSMVSLRVAAPAYGAVLRMAVSPSDPSAGVLQMPGGQSGHWLSPHFRNHHDDWLEGRPTPFLAGPPATTFELRPPP